MIQLIILGRLTIRPQVVEISKHNGMFPCGIAAEPLCRFFQPECRASQKSDVFVRCLRTKFVHRCLKPTRPLQLAHAYRSVNFAQTVLRGEIGSSHSLSAPAIPQTSAFLLARNIRCSLCLYLEFCQRFGLCVPVRSVASD